MAEQPPALEVRGLTKRFPGVLANDHIDLTLKRGQVLGLLGENGAGKSTLMNMIYGLYEPDEGEIRVKGQAIQIQDPRDAIDAGIGMVHQHFKLVDTLTVTENIMLGNESVITLRDRWQALMGQETPALRRILTLMGLVAPLAFILLAFAEAGAQPGSVGIGAGLAVGLAVVAALVIAFLLVLQYGGLLDRQAARQRIEDISKRYGLEVDPEARISQLPVGAQQRVEIIKALYRDADILILDEPTAVLTPQETQGLFQIMRSLVERGVSIIFISHKLKEVIEICDHVVVLRSGKRVGEADPKTSTPQSLASLMVGRDVVLSIDKALGIPGDKILSIRDLVVDDLRGIAAVRGISLDLYAGEILGVAGVQGNGQTELVEALTGLREVKSGRVHLLGHDITHASPRTITHLGTAHVPEDRQKMGMVMPFSVMQNMVLNTYDQPPFANGIFIDDPAIEANAADLVTAYDVRPPIINTPISGLSGGNQQKVIIAREFSRPVKLLIAAQPTRGLDVGSIEFIHQQIVRMRDEGTAVMLVSSELDEILSLSDRVAVMFAGQIIDVLPIAEADRDTVGLLMAGQKPTKATGEGTTDHHD